MPTIRPYQPKDKENVRNVCMMTGPASDDPYGPARIFELTNYCDYYVECEPECCFVVADDDDEAVGYIFGCADYRPYRERFLRDYEPKLKGLPLFNRALCQASVRTPKLFAKKYPAHLHINILEPYQRMGMGSRLMAALTARLREKGVTGVCLGMGSHNVKAGNFYRKCGFTKLLHLPGVMYLGLEL